MVRIFTSVVGLTARWTTAVAAAQCAETWRPPVNFDQGLVSVMTTWDPDGAGPEFPLLIAAGSFRATFDGVTAHRIAGWDGLRWRAFPNGPTSGTVNALTVHNGELIAAGLSITLPVNQLASIVGFDGVTWRQVGPSSAASGQVLALTSWNNDLYAGGTFSRIGTVNGTLLRWDGQIWHAIPWGMNQQMHVDALITYDNAVYVGGRQESVGGPIPWPKVYRWDGTTLSGVGQPMAGSVREFSVFRGELIAAGTMTNVGNIVRLVDGSWVPLAGGLSMIPVHLGGTPVDIVAIAEYEDELYVGGSVGMWGDLRLQSIGACDGVSWRTHPVADTSGHTEFAHFGGRLVAGGRGARIFVFDQTCTFGDTNCDGVVSVGDISSFVHTITNLAAVMADPGDCDPVHADLNHDGLISVGDIAGLVEAIIEGS